MMHKHLTYQTLASRPECVSGHEKTGAPVFKRQTAALAAPVGSHKSRRSRTYVIVEQKSHPSQGQTERQETVNKHTETTCNRRRKQRSRENCLTWKTATLPRSQALISDLKIQTYLHRFERKINSMRVGERP